MHLMPTDDPDRLSRRVIGFIQHLRADGFTVGHADTRATLDVLAGSLLEPADRARCRLKSLLAGNRRQWEAFDALFDTYWLQGARERLLGRSAPGSEVVGQGLQTTRQSHPVVRALQPERQELDTASEPMGDGHDDGRTDDRDSQLPEIDVDIDPEMAPTGELFGSDADYLNKLDLRHVVDPVQIRAAERQARRLAMAIRYRLSRRYAARARGRQLDLRRTLRANVSHGGEPIALIRRSPPLKPVRIVLFLDVSGSMQHYSRFFLQFIKALVNEWFDTDAYLFHTRLIRVTDVLREKDANLAMQRLSQVADGFGGGTNLANSLRTFNRQHAKSALTSRTVVFVLGDGYDGGGAERLALQLAQLKRRVRKLIWLNPLLGWENYRPTNASMKAARAHIDVFAAANTLESLARIEPMLESL